MSTETGQKPSRPRSANTAAYHKVSRKSTRYLLPTSTHGICVLSRVDINALSTLGIVHSIIVSCRHYRFSLHMQVHHIVVTKRVKTECPPPCTQPGAGDQTNSLNVPALREAIVEPHCPSCCTLNSAHSPLVWPQSHFGILTCSRREKHPLCLQLTRQ